MAIRESYEEGAPCWVDLTTDEVEGSKLFYSALFGWDWEEVGASEPGSSYHISSLAGRATAGLMEQHPEQADVGLPPVWNVHFAVDDLNSTMGKVEASGGSVIVPAFDVKDAHRMAVVADPTGAVLAFWQAGVAIGAEVVNEPGAFCWVDLITTDQATAANFYVEVVGMNHERQEMPGLGEVHFLKVGEDSVAAVVPPQTEGVVPHWETYFAVADCDESCLAIEELGGSVLAQPFDIPPGRMAVVADPAGGAFAIIKPADADH